MVPSFHSLNTTIRPTEPPSPQQRHPFPEMGVVGCGASSLRQRQLWAKYLSFRQAKWMIKLMLVGLCYHLVKNRTHAVEEPITQGRLLDLTHLHSLLEDLGLLMHRRLADHSFSRSGKFRVHLNLVARLHVGSPWGRVRPGVSSCWPAWRWVHVGGIVRFTSAQARIIEGRHTFFGRQTSGQCDLRNEMEVKC